MISVFLVILVFSNFVVLQETYRAAIVNNQNLMTPEFAVSFIPVAVTNDAEIVIYSEEPLNMTCAEAEDVTVNTNPCVLDNPESPILNQFSCAAQDNSVWVLLVFKEKGGPCEIGQEKCDPELLRYTHITAVVFDTDGYVVTKYQKIHTNYLDDYVEGPNEPGKTFTTDFGVTFGITICFDIVFDNPTEYLLTTAGVKNLIWPLIWQPSSPLLPFGAGMSLLYDVNVLMADWESDNQGSGIFAGGEMLSYIDTQQDALIYATLNKDGPSASRRRRIDYKEPTTTQSSRRDALASEEFQWLVAGQNYVAEVGITNMVTCTFNVTVSPNIPRTMRAVFYAFNSTYAGGDVDSISCGMHMCNNTFKCNFFPMKIQKNSKLALTHFTMRMEYDERFDMLYTVPKFMTDNDFPLDFLDFQLTNYPNAGLYAEMKPNVDEVDKVLTIDMMGVKNMQPFDPSSWSCNQTPVFIIVLLVVVTILL